VELSLCTVLMEHTFAIVLGLATVFATLTTHFILWTFEEAPYLA
jgi:hypothetical protein